MTALAASQGVAGVSLRQLLSGFVDAESVPDLRVGGLHLDSRQIRPGDVFVALQGVHAHGLQFKHQAIDHGCAAILYEQDASIQAEVETTEGLAMIAVEGLSAVLGHIADRFFGQPSRELKVVGITGTNGKTSCSHFLAEALAADSQSAVVGTLGWGKPGQLKATTHTTPDAIEIQRLLSQLRSEGFQAVAMEASSHGLVQGRLNGVRFTGALFTNFSRDHLDYHETLEAYLEAKLRLLDWPDLEFVVFNVDNPIAEPILRRQRSGPAYIGFCPAEYRCESKIPLLTFESVGYDSSGVAFVARFGGQSAKVKAPVFGDFNVENITGTIGVMLGLGYPFGQAVSAVGEVKPVPGRMENIHRAGRSVVIDYAHTPDAMASVLTSLRRHCAHKLWVIFGCGGDRDRGKRPEMGAIAARMADCVILTDDNPRNEDGDSIINDILKGIERTDVRVMRNREDAILYALDHSTSSDLVLIAGKGHEATQEIQGTKYPFSDRQVVEDILQKHKPG